MKVDQLLEKRLAHWQQLETLIGDVRRRCKPSQVLEFAALYRAACADLALADAYQLPPATVEYLHQLVGRAHNQLYRTRIFQFGLWTHELLVALPRRLFADRYLTLALLVFWGLFALAGCLTYSNPEFGTHLVTNEYRVMLEENFGQPMDGRSGDGSGSMAGFYIMNNAGIGLRCFAFGILLGIGGLFTLVVNAAFLGAVFGYMATTPQSDNFFNFVTAHGPFELTAIALSAAAGMRLGFSLVQTGGLSRAASLRAAGRQSLPTMSAALVLFVLAAFIEAFLSPSGAPYAFKAGVALLCTGMLLFYYFGLGAVRHPWAGLPPPGRTASD